VWRTLKLRKAESTLPRSKLKESLGFLAQMATSTFTLKQLFPSSTGAQSKQSVLFYAFGTWRGTTFGLRLELTSSCTFLSLKT
jgi:hypothetical protein